MFCVIKLMDNGSLYNLQYRNIGVREIGLKLGCPGHELAVGTW